MTDMPRIEGRIAIPANAQGMVAEGSGFWNAARDRLLAMRDAGARMTRSSPVGTGLLNVYGSGEDTLIVNVDSRCGQPVVPADADADAWFLDIAASAMAAPTIARNHDRDALRPVRAFIACRDLGIDEDEEVAVYEEFPGRGAVLDGFLNDEPLFHTQWRDDEILPTTVRLGVRELALSAGGRQTIVPVIQIIGRKTRSSDRTLTPIETMRMIAAWEGRKG